MRRLTILNLRIRSLFHHRRAEVELDDELRFHLEQLIAENVAAGMESQEARRAALRAFGVLGVFKEECRDSRRVAGIETTVRDLRHAVRVLRANPAFTTVAVLSLALGIGLNTALFSIVDAILLKTLPVSDPQGLVVIDYINPRGEADNFSYPLFQEIRDRVPVFSGVFASLDGTNTVDMDGFEAQLQLVSGEYFDVLGVRAALGRLLRPEDNITVGTHPYAVISNALWTRRFARDPQAVGSSVRIGRQAFTIVGVTPSEFFGDVPGRAPDVWAPLMMQPVLDRGASMLDKPNIGWLRVMARLRPGISENEASAAMTVFLDQLKAEPGRVRDTRRYMRTLKVSPGMRGLASMRELYSKPLRVLLAIVALILLIACANVANLLLARSTQRQREIAIRLAVGAGRGRVVRQLMTESTLLACLGGVLGILVAIWGTSSLLVLVSGGPEPLPLHATVDRRVLLFTAALSMLSSFIFGLVPALHATRPGASLAVTGSARPRLLLGRALVVSQVALSVLLLMGAGVFVRTLHNLRTRDLGFQPQQLIQARLNARAAGYQPQQLPELYERVLRALNSAPGITSASMSASGFNTGISRTCCVAIEGHNFGSGESREMRTTIITPAYFETLRLPLLAGRTFSAHDMAVNNSDPPRVAIINRTMARRYFGEDSAIGKRLGWGDPPKVKYGTEIIGVVEDANIGNLREDARPVIYYAGVGGAVIQVRTPMDTQSASAAIRDAVRSVDSALPAPDIRTISEIVDRALVLEKLMAKLSTFFGLLALLLAAIGLYGLTNYMVGRRTQEIGIRMALGASRAKVVWMISREATLLVGYGLALGLPLSIALGRTVSSMLFGVGLADRVTLLVVTGLIAGAALLSVVWPTRRAATVEPATALRYD